MPLEPHIQTLELDLRRTLIEQTPLPETLTLFHYTDASGLMGILSNQRVWATHTDHLNDSSEIQHGIKIIIDTMNDRLKSLADQSQKYALQTCIDTLRREKWSDKYIFCLTPLSMQLTQWRSYGDNGAGFMVGFNFYKATNFRSPENGSVILINVIYDDKIKMELINKSINLFLAKIKELQHSAPFTEDQKRLVQDFCRTAISHFFDLSASFKDSCFSTETEWRFVASAGKIEDVDIKIRTRGSELIRYIDLDLRTQSDAYPGKLPIMAIMAGNKHPDSDMQSLERLVVRNGYSPLYTKIQKANLPIR